MLKPVIMGIDPGQHGALAIMHTDGTVAGVWGYAKMTEADLMAVVLAYRPRIKMAYLEKAASRPGQGVRSVFTFGQNFGFWRGVLSALKIPFETVSPQTWQARLGCKSKTKTAYRDRKRALKNKAQQLFPQLTFTLDTADAVLIAYYGRLLNG